MTCFNCKAIPLMIEQLRGQDIIKYSRILSKFMDFEVAKMYGNNTSCVLYKHNDIFYGDTKI